MMKSNIPKLRDISLLDFIVISVLILYTASASTIILSDMFTVIVFIILLIIFMVKKLSFDKILGYVLIIWICINILSASFFNINTKFSIITFLGVTIRIIIPYLMLKVLGYKIFDKLLPYIYILSIISIILFVFQIGNVKLFKSLSPLLNFMTQEEQKIRGGWYIFIYMFSSWADDRNCGFLWEPGAYAAIIIVMMIYRLLTNNFKIDRIILVFTLALLTTYSTAGYLAFGIVITSYYIKKQKKILLNPIYLLAFFAIIWASNRTYKNEVFMEKKIKNYIEFGDTSYKTPTKIIRVSRLGIAMIALDYSVKQPLGNGILQNEYKLRKYGPVEGPNSLVEIVTQWGWLGLVIFYISLFRYFKHYTNSNIINLLFVLSLSIILFSNPFAFKYLFFLIFYYAFIFVGSSQEKLSIVVDQKKA